MSRPLKIVFLLLGVGLCAVLLWQADPRSIGRVLQPLGTWAPLVLLPYAGVYLLDTIGWRHAFGWKVQAPLTFSRLLRIRWAGESINNLVPSGYLGGEAVKIHLLRIDGLSGWTATEGVVIGKAVQILAQVLFIALGAALGGLELAPGSPLRGAMLIISALAAIAFLALFALLSYGFFRSLRWTSRFSRRLHGWFEKHRQELHRVDQQIRSFHRRELVSFLIALLAYFAGWLCDAVEIWFVGRLLGWSIDVPTAVAIEAFIGVAKALGTFIPGSLGVQESGVVLLFRGFGLTATEALAYAVVRRLRELVYALIGLGLLWMSGTGPTRLHEQLSRQSTTRE